MAKYHIVTALCIGLALTAETRAEVSSSRGTSKDYEALFSAVLSNMEETLKSKSRSVARVSFEEPAEILAHKLDAEAVDFLKRKVTLAERDEVRKLAVLTLAKLGAFEPASDVLKELVRGKDDTIRRSATTAISYMPREAACLVAQHALATTDNSATRVLFVELLGTVGDGDTRILLTRMEADEEDVNVSNALKRAAESLEHRLALRTPEGQQKWIRNAILYWRATSEVSPRMFRSATGAYYRAADQLIERSGPLSSEFLRHRLRQGELLAAVMVLIQRETTAIPELAAYAAQAGFLGETSRKALGAIGTPQAVRALETALGRPSNNDTVNLSIVHELTMHGDEASAELLAQLRKNRDYSERVRSAFATAEAHLRRRLAKRDPD